MSTAYEVSDGFVNVGTLSILGGDSVTVNDTTMFGTITNAGMMEAAGGSSLWLSGYRGYYAARYSTFINSGTIIADDGVITVSSTLQMSSGGTLTALNNSFIDMDAPLFGGTVQLENSTLDLNLYGQQVKPNPINGILTTTTIALSGDSDAITLLSATSLQFDQDTDTLTAYLQFNGSPYAVGEFHLTGTYTADEFSLQHGAIIYRAPGVVGIDVTDAGLELPAVMSAYSGPVTGVDYQYVNLSADNLNITVTAPNAFIHSGSGMDGLTVTSGNNILDGGGGSNFFIDGTGTDQNYVDARGATQDVWDTIANFHSGDNVTLWGITTGAYTLQWVGQQGASGYEGVTGVYVPNSGSGPELAFTLSGWSNAAETNGSLAITYSSIGGTPYASIHAV